MAGFQTDLLPRFWSDKFAAGAFSGAGRCWPGPCAKRMGKLPARLVARLQWYASIIDPDATVRRDLPAFGIASVFHLQMFQHGVAGFLGLGERSERRATDLDGATSPIQLAP
jgi:hypothetical protein